MVDGQIVIRPIMVVALTYDHRLLDGREAVTFLGTVVFLARLGTWLITVVFLQLKCGTTSKTRRRCCSHKAVRCLEDLCVYPWWQLCFLVLLCARLARCDPQRSHTHQREYSGSAVVDEAGGIRTDCGFAALE